MGKLSYPLILSCYIAYQGENPPPGGGGGGFYKACETIEPVKHSVFKSEVSYRSVYGAACTDG